MGRIATQRQRSSLSTMPNIEVKKPTITQENGTTGMQERTPPPANQEVEPIRPTITEDAIRQRAYEIYSRRDGTPGDEVSDWLQAERELLGE